MQHLVFRLTGPMAAWGDVAVGGVRPTADYPSKSAIAGLVAAALGIPRSNDVACRALASQLSMAVWVLSKGELLRDYHTVQVAPQRAGQVINSRRDEMNEPKLNTILSSRDYRTDSQAIVCLWRNEDATEAADQYNLEDIRAALLQPKSILYLGRKSCALSLPMEPQVIDGSSLSDIFHASKFVAEQPTVSHEVMFDQHPNIGGIESVSQSKRRDQLASRHRWQFAERVEYRGQFAATVEQGES